MSFSFHCHFVSILFHIIYAILVNEAKRLSGLPTINYIYFIAKFDKAAYLNINRTYKVDFWKLYATDSLLQSTYDNILNLLGAEI